MIFLATPPLSVNPYVNDSPMLLETENEGKNRAACVVISLGLTSLAPLFAHAMSPSGSALSSKIKEPTVLDIHVFSAPSLTLKPHYGHTLVLATKHLVGFILFQVEPFRFGRCPIAIWPIIFALLAHFALWIKRPTQCYRFTCSPKKSQWQLKELHSCLSLPRYAPPCPPS